MLELLGTDTKEPDLVNMLSRAVFVFISAIILMRIAGIRTFGKKNITDNMTLFIVGAILGRSIVASSPFLPSMAAVLLIVLLHRLIAFITFTNRNAARWISGAPLLLISEGKLVDKNLRIAQITEDDLIQSLRMAAAIDQIEKVKECYLEPSGNISVIKFKTHQQ